MCNVQILGKNKEKAQIISRELPADFECYAPAAAIIQIKGQNAGTLVFFANANNNRIYHYPFSESENAKYDKKRWKLLGKIL